MSSALDLNQIPAPFQGAVGQVLADKERLETENRLLREELRLLRIFKFGKRSEKLSDAQLLLLEGEPSVSDEEVAGETKRAKEPAQTRTPRRRKPHPGRAPFPAHLPRVERIIASPPEQCRCGQCQQEMPVFGYEQSEELGFKPAELFVWVNRREKRACPHHPEEGVNSAPAPAKIVAKGMLSDEFIIEVMLRKYQWHLPLYRQEAMLKREAGVEISRQTLCEAVMKAGEWLEPIRGVLREELLAGGYIQADETPIGVQSSRTRGRNHRGYLFEYSRPGGVVVFDFRINRAREGPEQFLKDYGGILQTDGYVGYEKVGAETTIRMACMAHIRRKFHEAHQVGKQDPRPLEVLDLMRQLYAVEAEARERKLGAAERLELRQVKSVGLMKRLKHRIVEIRAEVTPKSQLGKACSYALGQWERVEAFLKDGRIEIDNNWCENGLRPLCVGRRNWLHIGSEGAGKNVAAILSVFETCRRLDIDVRAYLTEVLPKLPEWPINRVAELSPMAWKAARSS